MWTQFWNNVQGLLSILQVYELLVAQYVTVQSNVMQYSELFRCKV